MNAPRETLAPKNEVIRFTVIGQPQTAGSKRAFVLKRRDGSLVTRPGGSPVVNVTDDNAKGKDWKRSIAWAARQAFAGELLRGPLRVTFTFYRPRPKGHFRTNGELNKAGAAALFPTTKPDVLKLARAAEDALTGVIWHDDAQIVEETLLKRWGEPARLDVAIVELADPPPQQLPVFPPPSEVGISEAARREGVPF